MDLYGEILSMKKNYFWLSNDDSGKYRYIKRITENDQRFYSGDWLISHYRASNEVSDFKVDEVVIGPGFVPFYVTEITQDLIKIDINGLKVPFKPIELFKVYLPYFKKDQIARYHNPKEESSFKCKVIGID